MNISRKIWYRFAAGILGLALFLFLGKPVLLTGFARGYDANLGTDSMGEGTRVFDYADLFSDGEEARLNEKLLEFIEKSEMDAVVVTIDDAEGKSSAAYADDFYDYNGFGRQEDHRGALFLIDMDNREIYLSTTGLMIRYMTDARVERLLDEAYEYLPDGDYAESAQAAIRMLDRFHNEGIPSGQHNYDSETGRVDYYKKRRVSILEGLISLILSVLPGLGMAGFVKSSYAMRTEKSPQNISMIRYRALSASPINLLNQGDRVVNTSTRTRIIPTSSGSGSSGGGRSTTHSGSSGRSHGGGGRSF